MGTTPSPSPTGPQQLDFSIHFNFPTGWFLGMIIFWAVVAGLLYAWRHAGGYFDTRENRYLAIGGVAGVLGALCTWRFIVGLVHGVHHASVGAGLVLAVFGAVLFIWYESGSSNNRY